MAMPPGCILDGIGPLLNCRKQAITLKIPVTGSMSEMAMLRQPKAYGTGYVLRTRLECWRYVYQRKTDAAGPTM
jgi:hypothetical protein